MKKTEEHVITYDDAEQNDSSHAYKKKKVIYKTYQVIWYILGALETVLLFRIFLKLIGANTASPFTQFVYNISYPFAYPFFGVVRNTTAPEGFVFEWSTILAMMVYGVIAYGLVYLLQLAKPTSSEEVEHGVEEV